jgi:hypothetical protein
MTQSMFSILTTTDLDRSLAFHRRHAAPAGGR